MAIKEDDVVYLPMFEGSLINGKMRSLADKRPASNTSGQQEISYCEANGKGWQLDDWSNTAMVEDLLILIGKTTDVQAKYGRGHDSGGSSLLTTGTLKNKGEFWGANSSDGSKAVKFFWLENYYSDRWDRKQGMVTNGSTHICVKMYPPYNINGTGYIDTGIVPSGSSGSYIKTTDISEYGNLPKTLGGASDKYQPDGCLYSPGCFLLFGGECFRGLFCGCAFALDSGVDAAYGSAGGSPSFKKAS